MKTDLVIINAQVFNSFIRKFESKNVAIRGEKFYYITPEELTYLAAEKTIDAKGRYMIPGLIDSHMHIESSMTIPSIFSKAALYHGVTTIVADSHEVANVFGIEGVEAFLKEETELDIFYAIPSSVPSTNPDLETTGGIIGLNEVRELLASPKVMCLGEVMNFKDIVSDPDSLINQIIALCKELRPNMPIEGHVPKIWEEDLANFIYHGITADHTHQSPESIYTKICNGMFIEMQGKSITKENIETIVKHSFYEYVALITDDVMADDLLTGHLNGIVKKAIDCGMPVEEAIYTSTYTPARRMGFQDRGAIVPGHMADFILLDDVTEFSINQVYKSGKLVHTKGEPIKTPEKTEAFPAEFFHSVQCEKADLERFRIPVTTEKDAVLCNVIQIQQVGTFTECVERAIPVKDGYLDWESTDLALLVVMERYGINGNIAYALVENTITNKGAIATTWAHDHHNLMVMGTDAADMQVAQHHIIDLQGGYVVVENEATTATCPLPLGGILSIAPLEELGKQLEEVRQAMVRLGYVNTNEIMSFSTLSLPVSPAIKITDVGMMNTRTQERIPLVKQESL
ncbi:adenine deaminase C-terminal domain-containing protein [Carnobacterium gallinarum]|uniref:adenine deaminase C-terminal domain-containing protein n=1 Tax=Carnobacterium gallinarum TaxID=2749 RepID=UPI00054E5E08|nr:adenine deaminase C-terminal domain-containing protein [Carnobacterium gallinarum]